MLLSLICRKVVHQFLTPQFTFVFLPDKPSHISSRIFCATMHLLRFARNGVEIPQVLPPVLKSFLSISGATSDANTAGQAFGESALEKNPPKKRKKKKKKKKKAKRNGPKGFDLQDADAGLWFNSSNKWFYNENSKLYFQKQTGPFFVYDMETKRLRPANS